jgi:hypothetical protein
MTAREIAVGVGLAPTDHIAVHAHALVRDLLRGNVERVGVVRELREVEPRGKGFVGDHADTRAES